MIRSLHHWLTSPSIPRRAPLLLAAAAAFSLVMAYVAQYGFGLHPCILCLYQRVPFAVVILLGLMGAKWASREGFLQSVLAFIAVSFWVGAGIAFFHSGVEYSWWEGTDSCGGFKDIHSVDALREMIMKAPVSRCSEAPFYFLGLSMAGWNIFWSGGLGLLAAMMLCARRCDAKN